MNYMPRDADAWAVLYDSGRHRALFNELPDAERALRDLRDAILKPLVYKEPECESTLQSLLPH